jgi:hypothetical protein
MGSKDFGIGRIFNHLRELQMCEYLSDLAILRFILYELQKIGKLPSKSKIGHHFRTKISKDDWEGSSKSEILKDLYNPTHE